MSTRFECDDCGRILDDASELLCERCKVESERDALKTEVDRLEADKETARKALAAANGLAAVWQRERDAYLELLVNQATDYRGAGVSATERAWWVKRINAEAGLDKA